MFELIFAIFPFLWLGIFIFVILSIFSPKFRGKLMSHQVKAVKHMTDYSKEDLEDIATNISDSSINAKKKILNKNKENLKDIADAEAYILSDSIKTKAKAIKDGLSDEKMYCKHCGNLIDSDSIFCKKCGKKQ